ncbi:DUF6580 family putative transport protein [Chitinophaga flava]|uniref:Rod shape-determining protein MreD n=1 Tax=Chitinophaga flava TaxID=2259036 RepID=A0A365XVC2_9BACT|nr:DUF6580 family putative transport protein [Chitinophaga flava]RBL90048.1 hypothetical protein DF182_26620 [Chitinophaga flava]
MKKGNYSILIIISIIAMLYRIIPYRLPGFAPQIAMFLFLPVVFRNKFLAYGVAAFSLIASDLLYHGLYYAGLSAIPGIYEGQLLNYLLLVLTPVLTSTLLQGTKRFFPTAIAGSVIYFLLSNSMVWIMYQGLHPERTLTAYTLTLYEGLPFFLNSVLANLFFGALICSSSIIVQEKSQIYSSSHS